MRAAALLSIALYLLAGIAVAEMSYAQLRPEARRHPYVTPILYVVVVLGWGGAAIHLAARKKLALPHPLPLVACATITAALIAYILT